MGNSNSRSGRSAREVRTSERRGNVMLFATIGKILIFVIIFLVILWLSYAVLGGPLSLLTWMYDLDPTMILVMISLVAIFFTFIFMNVVMSRGRGGGKK